MRNSLARTGLAVALVMTALAGCGGGSSASTPAASVSASTKAEDQRTDAATVATGMKALVDLSTKIADADGAQGKTLSDGIEPLWQPIEGTVQENSKATYDAFEAAWTLLESGDKTQAQQGAKAVADASAAYLAKFPG